MYTEKIHGDRGFGVYTHETNSRKNAERRRRGRKIKKRREKIKGDGG